MSPMSLGGVALYLAETLDHKFSCQLAHELPDDSTQVDGKLWHDIKDKSRVFFFGYSTNMPNDTTARRWGTLGLYDMYTIQHIIAKI
jgi:hypothetical protein